MLQRYLVSFVLALQFQHFKYPDSVILRTTWAFWSSPRFQIHKLPIVHLDLYVSSITLDPHSETQLGHFGAHQVKNHICYLDNAAVLKFHQTPLGELSEKTLGPIGALQA